MNYILVNYEVISGNFSAHCVRSFELNGKEPNEVIHSYFIDFWAENTEIGDKYSRYNHDSWEQSVKITGFKKITKEEYTVLRRLHI